MTAYDIVIDGMTAPPELVHFKLQFRVKATDPLKAAVIGGALTFKKIGQFMTKSVCIELVPEEPVRETDDQTG